MTQQTEFIPYEQALALKELGFYEPCFGRYIYDGRGKEWFLVQTQQTKNASVIFEGDISVDGISIAAPLYQQAFRWFREKYGYAGIPNPFGYEILDRDDINYEWAALYEEVSNNYEEAELACLKKLIEIVKNK